MELRELRYFRTIAELGSLSEAARTLHIAQPSLTVALRKLEKELGAQLLIRTARGVQPTEAGTYLRQAAERMLTDVERTGAHIRSLAAGQAGQLSLAITPTYSWGYLGTVLDALGQRAPGIQIMLRDPPPLEIVELLATGSSEVGIVATCDLKLLAARYGDTLDMRTICELPIVAVVPPALRGREPLSLDELRDMPWVVPSSSPSFPGLAALIEIVWREHGFRPRVVREVSTSQTGLPIVAGGLGVALMPDTVARLTNPRVAIRQIREHIPPLRAVLLWPRDRPPSPTVRRFMDIVLETHSKDDRRRS